MSCAISAYRRLCHERGSFGTEPASLRSAFQPIFTLGVAGQDPEMSSVKTGQGGYSYDELKRIWIAAEELGYDSAWLYDHFQPLGRKEAPCLESWTTLAALGSVTKKLKIGTMVTSVSYRHPSLLAKMATTVDIISGGRLILGIGAGWYEEEYHAYGYEFPDQRTRVRQLKEALIIIEKLWTEDRATFRGQFYRIQDAISMPKPKQHPRPRILVGITKGRKTPPYLAVRYADGFNTPTGSLEECRAILQSIGHFCQRCGKDLRDLTKSWQSYVLIGKTSSEVEEIVAKEAKERGQSPAEFRKNAVERGFVIGRPDECVQQLGRFKEAGINHFLVIFADDSSIQPLEIFRDEVIPQRR